MTSSSQIPSLFAMVLGLAEYEKLTHEVVATAADFEREIVTEKRFEALLASLTEGGEPVGFAIYSFNFATFTGRRCLYLEDLFVKPDVRKGGVGHALLQHLAATALERGCRKMEWRVLDWNKPAIDFYKKIGAEVSTEWFTCRLSEPEMKLLAEKAAKH